MPEQTPTPPISPGLVNWAIDGLATKNSKAEKTYLGQVAQRFRAVHPQTMAQQLQAYQAVSRQIMARAAAAGDADKRSAQEFVYRFMIPSKEEMAKVNETDVNLHRKNLKFVTEALARRFAVQIPKYQELNG